MKKFKRIFLSVVLISVMILFLYFIYRINSVPSFVINLPGPKQPTPNFTAVANWTPSPDEPYQASEVVATAWPTPVTRIMPADREAFRQAFLKKLTARSINWSLLSSLNHAGVSWRCEDIKIGNLSLPASSSGSLVAVWAAWYGGVDNSTMEIKVTDGSEAPPVNNTGNNSVDIYKNARVTITFPDFGIIGPEILQGNEVVLPVSKASILYDVWFVPRGWILGDDLITEKETDNTNLALDWARVDSIAPLQNDGKRSLDYLDLLYRIASSSMDPQVESVTLPNGGTITIDHTIYDTLMAIAKEEAVKAGYADVETLTIVITKPKNYMYLANRNNPVIPVDIDAQMADSTCKLSQLKSGITTDTLDELGKLHLANEPLKAILERLREKVLGRQ